MKLREVLLELGFKEEWGAMTDEQPAYWYDFGNLKLTATQVTNLRFASVFLMGGVVHDSRTVGEVSFEMPLAVESREQAVAWLAFGLGRRFQPERVTPWIEQGRAWANTLPWERKKREFAVRPHCSVDREWIRVAVKKLHEQASCASDKEWTRIEFDGDVLRMKTASELVAVPARGTAWERPYFLPTSKLEFLPMRMVHATVEVSVWEGRLKVGNRVFDVYDSPAD